MGRVAERFRLCCCAGGRGWELPKGAWLDEEIKRRALDFTAVEAVQLFYECSGKNLAF
jgi:hypothetical protein